MIYYVYFLIKAFKIFEELKDIYMEKFIISNYMTSYELLLIKFIISFNLPCNYDSFKWSDLKISNNVFVSNLKNSQFGSWPEIISK